MGWQDDPATQKQLNYLQQFGYSLSKPLTKGEASELIDRLQDDPDAQERLAENDANKLMEARIQFEKDAAYNLHRRVDEAAKELQEAKRGYKGDCKEDYKDSLEQRIEFWIDTITAESCEYEQACQLYESHGHRFTKPSKARVMSVLKALDGARPTWDKDYPHVFYQTLELNFPDLVRQGRVVS